MGKKIGLFKAVSMMFITAIFGFIILFILFLLLGIMGVSEGLLTFLMPISGFIMVAAITIIMVRTFLRRGITIHPFERKIVKWFMRLAPVLVGSLLITFLLDENISNRGKIVYILLLGFAIVVLLLGGNYIIKDMKRMEKEE